MVNSDKIKERMDKLSIKQKAIGEVLGIATPTVSQKINNVRPFSLEEAEKLAKVLHIEDEKFGEFFFGNNIA